MDIDPNNSQAPNTSNIGQISGVLLSPLLEPIPLDSSMSNSGIDPLPIEEVGEFVKWLCFETNCLQTMSEEMFYSPSPSGDFWVDNSHDPQKTPTQASITLPSIPFKDISQPTLGFWLGHIHHHR